MNIKKLLRENRFELIVFLIISLLMLPNFSNMYLWDDEGETALLAKNTALYGVPKVYDGKNIVSRVKNQYTPDFIWTWSSWLHIYVAALSFSVFGYSTFSARFLFVIIGILSFFPIVALLRKISINKMHYCLSVISLVFFVPYYLYSRQSRYFALLIFLMPVILISIYNLAFRNMSINKSIVWLVIAFTLLFHSNYLSFIVLMMSSSIYFIFILLKKIPERKKLLKKLALAYVLIFLLTFPWAVYANVFWKIGIKPELMDAAIRHIDYIFHSINSTIPLLLLAAGSIFAALFFRLKKDEEAMKQKISFVFFNSIIPIIIFIFPIYSDVRYLIGLFPLWISFALLPVVFLLSRKEYAMKLAGAIMLLLMLFTNIFYSIGFYLFLPLEGLLKEKCATLIPEKTEYCSAWIETTLIKPKELKYPFFYYLYEITHDYDSPTEGVVKYLNSNGDEDSVVFANNWYFSIAFYTNMKVLNHLYFKDTNLTPDFIVANFPGRRDIPAINYLITYAEENNYTKVTLPYPDLTWDNVPVLSHHNFWTPQANAPVTVYAKEKQTKPVS